MHRAEGMWQTSVPSSQFCCEPKSVLTHSAFLKNGLQKSIKCISKTKYTGKYSDNMADVEVKTYKQLYTEEPPAILNRRLG